MPRTRKPYVQREKTRHGKWVWYFRRGDGPRIRLHGDYESPEWLRDYEAAFAGAKTPEPARVATGTLRWLVNRYYDSLVYGRLAEATKRQRKSIYRRMLETGGDNALASINRKAITDARDLRSSTPAAAVCFVKAVRALFAWAVEAGHMPENPTIGVDVRDPKTEGHHTWTIEEVEQFREKFPLGTMPRLALDVLLFTGMRRSDAVRLGRQHIRDGLIRYRATKTGTDVIIPLLEPLRASIEAAAPKNSLGLIVSQYGTPFKSSGSFGNWFEKKCIEAGVPGRAHGLRKAGATLAAENGATDRELMAMFGWSTPRQAGTYTRKADQLRLARAAAAKLETGTSIPAPDTESPAPYGKRSNING